MPFLLIILLPLAAVLIATAYLAIYISDKKDWTMWKSLFAAIAVMVGIGFVGWTLLGDSIKSGWSSDSGSIEVKYRNDRVPVGNDSFETLGFTSDSTVKNAWYDASEEYLVIRLNSTNYHYCEVPRSVWDGLKDTGSPYTHYQDALRGNYDCRTHHLPTY